MSNSVEETLSTTNPEKKRSWFLSLKKGPIAFGLLLLCTMVTTMVVLASSPVHSSAAMNSATRSLPTLKNIISLGVAGPGGIAMTSAQVGWAFGANNVLHSSDGGRSWQVVAQAPANQVIRPLFVFDGQTAWYTLTETQTFTTTAIVRTSNGGQSWTRFDWISPTQFLNSISLFDQQFAWINTVDTSGAQPVFHLYLLGGSTPWQEVTLPGQDQVSTIQFLSQTVGWVVTTSADGSTQVLHMTSDGGQSWTTQTPPLPGNVPVTDGVSFQFLGFGDSQTGFLTGQFSDPSTGAVDSTQVYATSDGGQSWQIDGPAVPANTEAISQVNGWQITTAIPTFAPGIAMTSLNEGEWRVQRFTLPTPAESEFSIVTNRLLFDSVISADRTTQVVYETQNGGATWQKLATIPFAV